MNYFIRSFLFFFLLSNLVFANREIDCSIDNCDQLLAYYKMNNDWNDSKNSNHAVGHGGALFDSFSKVGSHSGFFDGYNDYAEIGVGDVFNFRDNFTWAAWYRSNNTLRNDFQPIFGRENGYYAYAYNFLGFKKPSSSLGSITFVLQNSIGEIENVGPDDVSINLSHNQWYYLVGTYNGSEVSTYVDGVRIYSNSSAYGQLVTYPSGTGSYSLARDSPWRIGRTSNTHRPSWFLSGNVDEVTVWNRSLNNSEINSLYNIGVMPVNSTTEFNILEGSTNFKDVINMSSVENMRLENSHGSITWDNPINAKDQDADRNVKIGFGFVSVNSSGLDNSWNSSSIISFEISSCSNYTIYYSSDFFLSNEEIIYNGQECNVSTTPACTDMICSGNVLSFSAERFSSYGSGGQNNPLPPPPVPEFSDYAIALLLLTVVGGFMGIRRKN